MTLRPEIIYSDRYLVAAVKPFGTVSEAGSFQDAVRAADICDSLYTVHRLDKACGGLILYAKDQKTASGLSSLFSGNMIEKTYLAIAEGVPETEKGRMDDLLFHDSGKNKTYVVDRVRRGVKQASLLYERIDRAESIIGILSLYEIRLLTGRTHQIRVQFASRKLPLYGDARYGSSVRKNSVALWSHRIRFTHPVTGEELDLSAPVPETEPWTHFCFQNQ